MRKYLAQTGWGDKVPEFKGDIEVLAINPKIADACMMQDYIHFCPVIKEVSAKDIEGTRLLPESYIPYLGIMNLIAN